jgi:hypothetical protein
MPNPSYFVRRIVSIAGAALILAASAAPAFCQSFVTPRVTREVDLSGPRFGLTMLNQATIDRLKEERDVTVRPMISQFGWQFERRFYTNDDGLSVLSEWIPLVSGLEQGLALPSLNWLVGVRAAGGGEFGIGPNLTRLGVGLVVAAGVTVRSGALNIPLNFAVASSKTGTRVSIMTGFNLRR